MLIMLRQGPVQALALASVYEPREMVKLRLDRLLKNGLIERASDRFTVNGDRRAAASHIQRLEKILWP
jgi:hypothetical protein